MKCGAIGSDLTRSLVNLVKIAQSSAEMDDDESRTSITSAWTLVLQRLTTGACVGAVGWWVGVSDGENEGTSVVVGGSVVGASVGDWDGWSDGCWLGSVDGSAVGGAEGSAEGWMVGVWVGTSDGNAVGESDGASDGVSDGALDGASDGVSDGVGDGCCDGK